VAIVVFCFGLLAPTATHEAVRPLPHMAGAAAGALRSLQMLIGAGASALVTVRVSHFTAAMAMASVMAASVACAVAIYIALLWWPERAVKRKL